MVFAVLDVRAAPALWCASGACPHLNGVTRLVLTPYRWDTPENCELQIITAYCRPDRQAVREGRMSNPVRISARQMPPGIDRSTRVIPMTPPTRGLGSSQRVFSSATSRENHATLIANSTRSSSHGGPEADQFRGSNG